MSSTLSFLDVSLAWPDGRVVFDGLTFAIPPGLSGIVGRNGIGKSTLLRLAAGDLEPTSGRVVRPDRLAYVPQGVTLVADDTVAEALRIGVAVAALRAIEAGSVDPTHYEAVGDDWAIEERAAAVLADLGLPAWSLDRCVGEVSGGEAMLLAVGSAMLADADALLLDEPTNNLDAVARDALIAVLAARRGTTVVVTHDRDLLDAVERIGEVRERPDRATELRWFGGAFAAFEEEVSREREAAAQGLATARNDAARQHRDLTARVEAAGKRSRQADRARANSKVTRAGVKVKTDQAARTEARVRGVHEERLAEAAAKLAQARDAIPKDRTIRIELADTELAARRHVLRARDLMTRAGTLANVEVMGPERIHVAGRNGSGKTTLIETVLGLLVPSGGEVSVAVPWGYLPQRLDGLDDSLSVTDNLLRRAPSARPQEVRDQLGRFQFRGAAADALAGTLSGGERFRAALACVLLARPAPQLLVLDEPTNNLDFASREQLLEALAGYGGALVVVSHDDAFVEAVAPTRLWELGDGALSDVPLV